MLGQTGKLQGQLVGRRSKTSENSTPGKPVLFVQLQHVVAITPSVIFYSFASVASLASERDTRFFLFSPSSGKIRLVRA